MRFDVTLSERLSRQLLPVKLLLIVPHVAVLCILWPVQLVLSAGGAVCIVVTGHYPDRVFRISLSITRWFAGVAVYHCSLSDDNPPLFSQPPPIYGLTFDVAQVQQRSRVNTALRLIVGWPLSALLVVYILSWLWLIPWLIGLATVLASGRCSGTSARFIRWYLASYFRGYCYMTFLTESLTGSMADALSAPAPASKGVIATASLDGLGRQSRTVDLDEERTREAKVAAREKSMRSREEVLDRREASVDAAEKSVRSRQDAVVTRESKIVDLENEMRSREAEQLHVNIHLREGMLERQRVEAIETSMLPEQGGDPGPIAQSPAPPIAQRTGKTLGGFGFAWDAGAAAKRVHDETTEGPQSNRSSIVGPALAARTAIIYEETAIYEGGHPKFLKKSTGKLVLLADRLEFKARKNGFVIAIHEIVRCELKPMQFSALRSMIGGEDRAIQVQTPMAFVTCNVDGFPRELRFHVSGALTIPGESENARKFKDALYTLAPSFARDVSANSVEPPTIPAPVTEDATETLRDLAALRRDGIITEEEFASKKAELLDRM